MTEDRAKKFIAERDAAFLAGDLDWVRKNMPRKPSSDLVVEMAFHKARLEVRSMPHEVRKQSADWLSERGYSRFDGTPPHSALEVSQ